MEKHKPDRITMGSSRMYLLWKGKMGMIEQIENAIKTFNQLLFLGKVDLPKEEIENDIKTAIYSLQAWLEVLNALEEFKLNPTLYELAETKFAYQKAINTINQKLSEIEKVR